jgi:hypothetical protein
MRRTTTASHRHDHDALVGILRQNRSRVPLLAIHVGNIDFSCIKSTSIQWKRSFSTTNDGSNQQNRSRNEKNRSNKRLYQQKAAQFLQAVQNGRIQRGLVPLKAEEHLLMCVSDKSDRVPTDGPLALDLLNAGISNARLPGERLIPRLFSLACQIMVRCGHPSAFQEVYGQVWRLLDGWEQFLRNDGKKQTIAYNSRYVNDACSQLIHHQVMQAINDKKTLNKRSEQQLRRLIQRLEQIHADPAIPLVGDGFIEDAIVLFLCHEQKPQEAFERVQRKLQNNDNSNDIVRYQPPVSTFTSIMSGFARINQPDQARRVIEWMLKELEKDHESAVPLPNETCFNALAHAYATVGGKDAGFKAEEVLAWMRDLHETKGYSVTPDTASFNIAINAWARSGHRDAPMRAENLLQDMVRLFEAGHDIRPTVETWSCVMNTWVNSGKSESVERVAAILDLMEQLSENSVDRAPISDFPYTTYVKALEQEGLKRKRQSDKLECVDKMFQVIDRVRGRGLEPSPEMYNAVLTAIKSISLVNGVLYFLELERLYRLGIIRLATRTFNIGLNAIATMNTPDADEKAHHALKRMEEYAKSDPQVTPTRYTINIMLKVLSRSHADDAAARADDLLRKMDDMPLISPDSTSYVTSIIAWGRSTQKDKLERVKDLLTRYLEHGAGHEKQNVGAVKVFNAALSVCYHSAKEHPTSSVKTAEFVMYTLRQTKVLRPDQLTYISLFRVFENAELTNVDVSSVEFLKNELEHCIKDGLASTDVLAIVRSFSPDIMRGIVVPEISQRVL